MVVESISFQKKKNTCSVFWGQEEEEIFWSVSRAVEGPVNAVVLAIVVSPYWVPF